MHPSPTRAPSRSRQHPASNQAPAQLSGSVQLQSKFTTERYNEVQKLGQRPSHLQILESVQATQRISLPPNPTRGWGPNGQTESSIERPFKRARLTEKNLGGLEITGGSARKYADELTSTTTTTPSQDFATRLQHNNVVYTTLEARAPDDVAEIKTILDRTRDSPPPDPEVYNQYLALTENYDTDLSVEVVAYPILAKRTPAVEKSGYFLSSNHVWSAVDNCVTTKLSAAQPDISESYRRTAYPKKTLEVLSGDLAPSLYNEAMPAYAVEFKSSNDDMREAKLRCAYDGALMTEGARALDQYLKNPSAGFYGKTQALTVAYDGHVIYFYGHHAVDVVEGIVEYHQYCYRGDTPCGSIEDFQRAYKHLRNWQELGYRLSTKRKNALWAYENKAKASNSTKLPVSPMVPLIEHPLPAVAREEAALLGRRNKVRRTLGANTPRMFVKPEP